ncbi:MAG: helix-turn-helix domain-containing protein [Oscillospiraceae bacterium]
MKKKKAVKQKKKSSKLIYEISDYADKIRVFSLDETVSDITDSFFPEKYKGDTFGTVLVRLIAEKGIYQSSLSKMTGISETAIARYINGSLTPKLNRTVAICIALRLSYQESKYLMDLNNICINSITEENLLYTCFLLSCMFDKNITVMSCNEILEKHGYEPLTGLRRFSKKY